MFVSALRIEFHIPLAHSLKEKRAVVRPIIDGLHHRFHVAASEVDFQDLWQRCAVGVAVVGGDVGHLEKVLETCERFVESFPEIEVLSIEQNWLE
jgi:uncharacterized protein